MGGTSVTLQCIRNFTIVLNSRWFPSIFSWHACCIYVFVGWCRSFMKMEFLEKRCGVA